MAWEVARQIYHDARVSSRPQHVRDSLLQIDSEPHRAQVAAYVLELALREKRVEIADVARPYADKLQDFKPSHEAELKRFRDKDPQKQV